MNYKDKLDYKMNRLENVFRNPEVFPVFHPAVHEISSYQTGVISFILPFTENVHCTFTHTVNH